MPLQSPHQRSGENFVHKVAAVSWCSRVMELCFCEPGNVCVSVSFPSLPFPSLHFLPLSHVSSVGARSPARIGQISGVWPREPLFGDLMVWGLLRLFHSLAHMG